jgi:hypothetical protein
MKEMIKQFFLSISCDSLGQICMHVAKYMRMYTCVIAPLGWLNQLNVLELVGKLKGL